MKRKLLYNRWMTSIIIMGLAVTVVVVLALVAAGPSKNGFTRKFITAPLTVQASIEKNENITGIAGSNKEYLFFGTNRPDKLFVTDHNLANGHMINTPFKYNKKTASNFSFIIDSTHIELFAGNARTVLSGTLNRSGCDSFNLTERIFTRAVKIDSGYYAIRRYDQTRNQQFIKTSPRKGAVIITSSVTPQYNDAGISTDGMLHYDPVNKILVYISYYSNRVYLMDNNLIPIELGHTVDTIVSIPRFVGEESEGEMRTTLTNVKPKRVINANSSISKGIVYVLSKLQSDMEKPQEYTSSSVIDCYVLPTFKYVGSFYIPDYQDQKLRHFKVMDKNVISIFKNMIVKYPFPG